MRRVEWSAKERSSRTCPGRRTRRSCAGALKENPEGSLRHPWREPGIGHARSCYACTSVLRTQSWAPLTRRPSLAHMRRRACRNLFEQSARNQRLFKEDVGPPDPTRARAPAAGCGTERQHRTFAVVMSAFSSLVARSHQGPASRCHETICGLKRPAFWTPSARSALPRRGNPRTSATVSKSRACRGVSTMSTVCGPRKETTFHVT